MAVWAISYFFTWMSKKGIETIKPAQPQQAHTQNGVHESSLCSCSEWSVVNSMFSRSQLTSSEHGNTESTITKSDNMRAKRRTYNIKFGVN